MGRYQVQLRGENFLLNIDGEHGKFGFTVTRIIKANDPEEAKRTAIIRIHQELNQSPIIVKNIADAPRVYPEQVKELKFFRYLCQKKNADFNFVTEENQQV
jgi:hypothetical protein